MQALKTVMIAPTATETSFRLCSYSFKHVSQDNPSLTPRRLVVTACQISSAQLTEVEAMINHRSQRYNKLNEA